MVDMIGEYSVRLGGPMNNSKKVFMVLVLAGMFLLPPVTALDTGNAAGSDAQSPSQPAPAETARPNGLARPIERADVASGAPVLAALSPEPGECYPIITSQQGGSRGPRAAPDIYPYTFAVVPPDQIRMWRGLVPQLKNADTQWNVTVNNSGDADATGATVTMTYIDINDKQMAQLQQTGDITAGSNATFYFVFRTTYCTWFYINITVSVSGDTNPNNDAGEAGYFGVALWGDELSSTTGWSGDISNTKWHISDSPEGDTLAYTEHTAPNCLYAGRDAVVGFDGYDSNMNAMIKTQTLDLRGFGKQYFLMFDYQFHGKLPLTDAGDYYENYISTDNGLTWSDARAHIDGPMIGAQDMVTLSEHWLHWVTPTSVGSVTGLDLSQYAGKTIQIKTRIVSNAANEDWGLYFDDWALWGVEIFNDSGIDLLTDLADMKINEKKDFDVKVTNYRQAQTAGFNCSLNITVRGDPTHFLSGFPVVKTVSALGTGQSQNLQFSWTPAATGDYVLVFNISGMPDEDRTNDAERRWAHVSSISPRILIVDDDPFVGYLDYTSDTMFETIINVTGNTPDEHPYADYGVYYTWWKGGDGYRDWGGDGPSAALMGNYEAVIWLTGSDTTNLTVSGTLTANDQANLTTYLNGGGALWLSSMGVMNDLGLNTFARNYLHVDSVRNDTLLKPTEDTKVLPSPIVGVPGSLAEGASYTTAPPTGLNSTWDKTDLIRPDASAQGVFFGNTTAGDPWYVAIQYSGASYRSVFQSFDYAWIAFENPDRRDYTKRVLSFLMGGLEMQVVGQTGTTPFKQMVDPGGSAVFTFYLNNTGTRGREIDNITVDPTPQGWTTVVDPNVQEGSPPTLVGKEETLEITLTVTAPQKALAGERADLGLNVTFKDYYAILFNRTVTEVNAIVKVELAAANTVQNITGAGSVSYPFTVRNLGNLQLTVELQKTGEHFEWLQLSVSSKLMNAYEEWNTTAMMSVPEGAYRQAGNYTLTTTLTSRAIYQDKSSNSTLNLTTNIRVAQVFAAKIDDVELAPSDGLVDMSVAKPSVKMTVTVSSAKGNGPDNISVELKSKSFAPTTGTGTGPSRSWDGAGWNLPKTVVDTTPFMTLGKDAQLTVFVPAAADAGEYTIEVRAIPGSGKISDGDSTTVTVKVTKPDLQFGGTISFTPKEPEVGTPVKMKVVVKNLGGTKATNVDVAFYDSGDNLIESKTLSELAAGGSQNVEIEWTAFLEGENLITVRVDPDSKISEILEDNNELTETVVGQRSDLQLDGEPVFKVGGIVKTSVKSGDTFQVEITVKNVGTWSLNLTSVQVRLTDQKTGEILTETINSLPTRSDAKVTFTLVAKKDGAHPITIKVNPDGAMREKDLNNNEATGTIKVYTPAVEPTLPITMLAALGGIIAVVVIVALVFMMRKKKPAAAPAYPPMSAPPEEPVAVVAEEVPLPPPPPPPPQGPPVMR
jgi:uncharacterized membrane protein